MAAIRSLLNPLPEGDGASGSELERNTSSTSHAHTHNLSLQARKKQKIVKDAAVFTRGPVRGKCRYPPHESQDRVLVAQHEHFQVYPIGEIAEYPRHIPYNSEKKSFLEKTGRECLEVFQYRFKIPNDDTTYTMLWDYNIGLVRTTPLFKCTGHSKTTPAKMLNRNHGLREICHSITGGALVAQGYWMPYDAAKAIATTFCWSIRYALTPIFGIDFPTLCYPPDHEKYGDMLIDPKITKACAKQAKIYKEMEHCLPQTGLTTPSPVMTDTAHVSGGGKKLQPKAISIAHSPHSSSAEEQYGFSTQRASLHKTSTPANTPRSVPSLLTPESLYTEMRNRRRGAPKSPELSPRSQQSADDEDGYDGGSSDDESCVKRAEKMTGYPSDEKAAYLLMSLRMQGSSSCHDKRKRRASD